MAQERVEGIVAVVNEDVITASDLFERFALVSSSSGLPNTPEVRNKFLPQILNVLIDEKLQLQEATRLEIEISPQEIEAGVRDIAQQNRMDAEQFMQLIDSRDLSTQSLKDQVRAQAAWRRVIQRRLRSQVDVTPQDVEAEYERLLSNAGKIEYNMAEIFLPIDENNTEQRVRELSGEIVSELATGQTNFPALARQFSQNASAGAGGLLGWVFEDQIPEEVASELSQMQPGSISRPIKTLSGYHIVLLQNKRVFEVPDEDDIQVDLKQVFIPFGDSNKKDVEEKALEIKADIGGCLSISNYYDDYQNSETGSFGLVSLSSLNEDIKELAQTIAIAEVSEPILREDGVLLMMICERDVPKSNFPSNEAISSAIGQERLDVLQRRHLRDLRATAFIERRV